jgi:hypothetical protein
MNDRTKIAVKPVSQSVKMKKHNATTPKPEINLKKT